jgi:hypothetical protein
MERELGNTFMVTQHITGRIRRNLVGPVFECDHIKKFPRPQELSYDLLFYQPSWGRLEMQKGQTIDDMQKVGAKCAGHSDGDAHQLHCFFSSLFFKALLLYNSLKPCFFSIL